MEYNGDLILVRGCPGAGKTTFAELIGYVISSDDYFINANGEYIFDGSKLKYAHEQSRLRCEMQMGQKDKLIIVANTFTQKREMAPYFDLAEEYNYRVHTIIVENRHGGTNIHGVPDDKLKQMKDRFEVKL